MCYDRINDYMNWVDEATSKSELIEVLKDIKEDILVEPEYDDDDDDDNTGGRQYYKSW